MFLDVIITIIIYKFNNKFIYYGIKKHVLSERISKRFLTKIMCPVKLTMILWNPKRNFD